MKPRPRVLHLLSDWKWTGPAEPVVNLCRGLTQKGFPVELACAAPPSGALEGSLASRARERHVEPILDLRLDKRPNYFTNRRDIRTLARLVDDEEFQIIHVHTTHDHYIGSRAARRANNCPRIVRTNHTGVPLARHVFQRLLVRGRTHGWVAYSPACLSADCAAFGIAPEMGVAVEGAVDLSRFRPDAAEPGKRPEFGFAEEHVVFGVVARIQPRRRFDVIVEAFRRAVSLDPRIRGLVLGRGTHQERLLVEPLRQWRIEDRVTHGGYRDRDYVASVACMDVLIFLVPGTDGSCRAAREAMAIGKPVIASARGILPELVEDGRCGFVIGEDPDDLVQAMLRLTQDAELRRRLGQAALDKARSRFDISRQVQRIGDLYMRIADLPG